MSHPALAKPTYYLRIEGVNLGPFVFDTRDLSTTRGSSLLLLNMVKKVAPSEEAVPPKDSAISQGASIGLWEVTTDDPAKVASEVRKRLSEKEYAHGTFVVDMVPVGEFRENVESLLAANRWRQMQSATLSIPPVSTVANDEWKDNKPVCGLDGLREAVHGDNDHKFLNQFMSKATRDRREYGRTQKQAFYAPFCGGKSLEFVNEFKDIAVGDKPEPARSASPAGGVFKDIAVGDKPEPLNGKMAVFYADGNNFGKFAAGCKERQELQEWDKLIRKWRRQFLTKFLSEVKKEAGWIHREECEEQIRFETLLWGGDELMFVMPARFGWRFTKFFFDQFGDAEFQFKGEKLTHTASLVFCQHHSPIHRIKHLLKDGMAEFAKEKDRKRDQLVCVALESFDHLGTSYERSMAKRYGAVALEQMILAGKDGESLAQRLGKLAEKIDDLKKPTSEFARSQLRALVVGLVHPDEKNPVSPELEKAFDSHFFHAKPPERDALTALEKQFPSPAALWLTLEELWDYALP